MTVSRIGQMLGGRYLVESKIGEGGQSTVYKARDVKSGRDVAVKVMHEKMAQDADAQQRMSREAAALERLAIMPAALKMVDMCWSSDSCMCLVTELLTGMDLDDYLAKRGERLTVPEVVELLGPVVDVLDTAHSLGIVHRDIKPGNVFVTTEPKGVRLLDFGFAKFAFLASITVVGSVAGSPRYIAPEAWLGRKDLDARIDVYSFGALIFRCLAGHTPFQQEHMLHLWKAVTEAPRPSLRASRRDIPPAIDDWVQLALAIDREQRFQNIRALWSSFLGIVRAS
jgi:serine/threonine-protein kinase